MGARGVAFWTILGAIFDQRSLKKCQGDPKGAQSHEKEVSKDGCQNSMPKRKRKVC